VSWPHVLLLLGLAAWLGFKLGLATAELDALELLEREQTRRDWEEHVRSVQPYLRLREPVDDDLDDLADIVAALEDAGLAVRRPNLRVVR
jgi:hypothetical protein